MEKRSNPDPALTKRFRVSLLDVATLLVALHKGAQHPEIGFEDAEETLDTLTKHLAKQHVGRLSKKQVESALWSANLMDEVGQFWSPRGESFDAFVQRLLRDCGHNDVKFNKEYNWIE